MSNEKRVFYVEKLDTGFVLTYNNQRTAITNLDDLEEKLQAHFSIFIKRLKEHSVKNAQFSIEKDENPPKGI